MKSLITALNSFKSEGLIEEADVKLIQEDFNKSVEESVTLKMEENAAEIKREVTEEAYSELEDILKAKQEVLVQEAEVYAGQLVKEQVEARINELDEEAVLYVNELETKYENTIDSVIEEHIIPNVDNKVVQFLLAEESANIKAQLTEENFKLISTLKKEGDTKDMTIESLKLVIANFDNSVKAQKKREVTEEMKNIMVKEVEESVNLDSLYTLKESKSGGKKVLVLTVTEAGWKQIKHLFKDSPKASKRSKVLKGNSVGVTEGVTDGKAKYDLMAQEVTLASGVKQYRISGASGDYTIGLPPAYYELKYNRLKPGEVVLNAFVDSVFSNTEAVEEDRESSDKLYAAVAAGHKAKTDAQREANKNNPNKNKLAPEDNPFYNNKTGFNADPIFGDDRPEPGTIILYTGMSKGYPDNITTGRKYKVINNEYGNPGIIGIEVVIRGEAHESAINGYDYKILGADATLDEIEEEIDITLDEESSSFGPEDLSRLPGDAQAIAVKFKKVLDKDSKKFISIVEDITGSKIESPTYSAKIYKAVVRIYNRLNSKKLSEQTIMALTNILSGETVEETIAPLTGSNNSEPEELDVDITWQKHPLDDSGEDEDEDEDFDFDLDEESWDDEENAYDDEDYEHDDENHVNSWEGEDEYDIEIDDEDLDAEFSSAEDKAADELLKKAKETSKSKESTDTDDEELDLDFEADDSEDLDLEIEDEPEVEVEPEPEAEIAKVEQKEWEKFQATVESIGKRKTLMGPTKIGLLGYRNKGELLNIEDAYISSSTDEGEQKPFNELYKEIDEHIKSGKILTPGNIEVITELATGEFKTDFLATEGEEKVQKLLDRLNSVNLSKLIDYAHATFPQNMEFLELKPEKVEKLNKRLLNPIKGKDSKAIFKEVYPKLAEVIFPVIGKDPVHILGLDNKTEVLDAIKTLIEFMVNKATTEKSVKGSGSGGHNKDKMYTRDQNESIKEKQATNRKEAGKSGSRTDAMKEKIWGDYKDKGENANTDNMTDEEKIKHQAKLDWEKQRTDAKAERVKAAKEKIASKKPVQESLRRSRRRKAVVTEESVVAPKKSIKTFVEESVKGLTQDEAISIKQALVGKQASWIKENITTVIKSVIEESLTQTKDVAVTKPRTTKRKKMVQESFQKTHTAPKEDVVTSNYYNLASSFL
jgi:hypothetical protein